MRTITKNIYQFNELSEDARQAAIDSFRDDMCYNGFAWDSEWRDSLKAFEDELSVDVKDWQIGPDNYRFNLGREQVQNAMHGRKLKEFDRDYMPTGYCADCDLWITLHDEWKKTGDPVYAVESAIDAFFTSCKYDMEYQLSDEYIIDMIVCNEYEFDEDGTLV